MTEANELNDVALPEQPLMMAWWTRGQVEFLAVVFLSLFGLVVGMLLFNRDDLQVLWTDPLGKKMGVGGLFMAVFGGAVYLVACAALNYFVPPGDSDGRFLRKVLSSLQAAAVCLVFFLPAANVVIVGPAAIRMVNEMLPTMSAGY